MPTFIRLFKLNLFFLLFLNNLLFSGTTGKISGIVRSGEADLPLVGVNVALVNTLLGAVTNQDGRFTLLNIPPGDYQIQASMIGYANYLVKDLSVRIDQTTQIDILMTQESIEMVEVIVQASRPIVQLDISNSQFNVSSDEISDLPIDEISDILDLQAGVNGLSIRGGSSRESLFRVDGFSFNDERSNIPYTSIPISIIKEIQVQTGGFNAEYGGRISSVLDVISREGNSKNMDARVNISLLSAQGTIEGPLYKGAWLISGRRTYFDKIFKNNDNIPPYYFYDLQGHVFSDISPDDRISLSFYSGLDDLEFSNFDLKSNWGNNTISLKYRKLLNRKLIGNLLLAKSQFHTEFKLGGESGLVSSNVIDDYTASCNFTYFYSNNLTHYFGVQAKRLGFNYENKFNDSTNFRIDVIPYEVGVFTKFKWLFSDKIIIEPGFRLDYYSKGKSLFYPNPRLGVKWILNEDQFLNFSLGKYYQFIETFQDDYNPPVLDSWFAVDKTVKPASSNHYIAGYERYFSGSYRFQLDGYYKNIYNMLTFEETRASTDGKVADSSIVQLLTPADGYATGMEVFLQKTRGRLTGWLAYTYSISVKIMNDLEYFTNWDRRHVFNVIGNYRFKDNHGSTIINRIFRNAGINWKFTFQSGQAYTPILGYYVENLPDFSHPTYRTTPGGRNGGRYPEYHRLDIGFNKQFHLKHFDMDFYIQVINAYNRENIFRFYYTVGSIYNGFDDDGDWDENLHDVGDEYGFGANNGKPDRGEPNVDEADETIIKKQEISLFPIIPTIGFSFEF